MASFSPGAMFRIRRKKFAEKVFYILMQTLTRRNPKFIFQPGLKFEYNFAPCKGNPSSLGFWIPRHGFRILGTGFQILR